MVNRITIDWMVSVRITLVMTHSIFERKCMGMTMDGVFG